MSTAVQNLSADQMAAIAAIISGNAAGNVAASQQNGKGRNFSEVDPRPVVSGTAFTLCRLLGTKNFDEAVSLIDKDGSVVVFDDNWPVTFGDLKGVTHTRPDG